MRGFVIYALHHDESTRVYIGKSSSGLVRPQTHMAAAYRKRHAHLPVIQWIEKRFRLNQKPIITILEECSTSDELTKAECFYISYFRSIGVDLLNVTDGGDGAPGRKLTAASRSKLADSVRAFLASDEGREFLKRRSALRRKSGLSLEARSNIAKGMRLYAQSDRGRAHMALMTEKSRVPEVRARAGVKAGIKNRGRVPTSETIAKISLASKGRKRTPEQNAKLSAALTGKKRPPEVCEKMRIAFTGRKMSDTAKAKMSMAKLGKRQNPAVVEKRAAANRGKKRTPEQVERLRVAIVKSWKMRKNRQDGVTK